MSVGKRVLRPMSKPGTSATPLGAASSLTRGAPSLGLRHARSASDGKLVSSFPFIATQRRPQLAPTHLVSTSTRTGLFDLYIYQRTSTTLPATALNARHLLQHRELLLSSSLAKRVEHRARVREEGRGGVELHNLALVEQYHLCAGPADCVRDSVLRAMSARWKRKD